MPGKKSYKKTKIEKKIEELWDAMGSIEFNSFFDLAMMLGENYPSRVREAVYRLIDRDKLCLISKNGHWYLDYIKF